MGELRLQGKGGSGDDDLRPFLDTMDQSRRQIPQGFSGSGSGLNQEMQFLTHRLVDGLDHRHLARSLLTPHLGDGYAEEIATHLADLSRLTRHDTPPRPQRPAQDEDGR